MLYPLFTQILNMGITASFVIVVIVLIRSIMYGLPKKYQYLLWGIVGVRLICPIAISSSISVFNMIGTDVTAIISMEKMESKANSGKINENGKFSDNLGNQDLPDNEVVKIGSNHLSEKEPAVSIETQKGETENTQTKGHSYGISTSGTAPFSVNADKKQINPIIKYGSIIWLIGMAWILLWNFYMTFCMKKKLERAVRYKENIYECENIPSPFVIGIFCPKIYIPFQLNTEEREYILKHELYHIKRKDYIIKPIAFLLVCIYWFHPLVWLSYVLMIRDMEMSCDEYVLQNVDADIRKDYSKSLLGFAVNQRGMAAGLLGFGETDTRRRVKNVLNFKKHGKWIGVLAAILIIIVGTTCLTNAKNTDKKINKEEKKEEMSGEEDNKKEEKEDRNQEAVIASTEIHGYDLQLVYVSEEELPDKNDLDFDMYEGTFELRTYREQIKYAEYPLTFDFFKDTLYYPCEGLELIVKDYDGDGAEDDFALGQGQTSWPYSGNYMSYQFYTVDEDGTIARYEFSEGKKNLATVPDEYSKDFSCKNGQITYQALGENGVEEQTVSVVRLIPVNAIKEGMPLQDLMTAIETAMPKPIVEEVKEKGCWRIVNGTYCLGNAESNDDITMRLDFSYFGEELEQYVSKEYGFVDQEMTEDRIDDNQAKELIIAFESAFLGRQIQKNDIKTYQSYSGYEGNDYAAFIDSNQDTFLVQLSRNMVIKYNADKKRLKKNAKKKEDEELFTETVSFTAFNENHTFYFPDMNVTIELPENKNWIQEPKASAEEDIGIVTYYDNIAETDAALYFGKKSQKEMLGFSENSDFDGAEYWTFYPGTREKLITVQFYAIKNSMTTVVLSWEYNKINFYMTADFTDPALSGKSDTIAWEALAKTAAYIAEHWYHVLEDSEIEDVSEKDLKAAKKAVQTYFKKKFPDCELQKLWFDKEIYRNQVTRYCNLYGKDDVIILISDFYVPKDCKANSLEKDCTYGDFRWILSKKDKNSDWEVKASGY